MEIDTKEIDTKEIDTKEIYIKEMETKFLTITTTNNSNTKKINYKKERKKRVEVNFWNITIDDLSYNNQFQVIYNLYHNILNNIKIDKKYNIFVSHIKNKISSYKQQDTNKKIYNPILFTTFIHVLDLLVISKLKCVYCNTEVYILYELVRESKQWTLDRIDNNIGHNINNLVIACLECNLKRRRTNKDSFMFTKNMKIIREGIETNNI
jgi:hypothetical protein